MCSVDYLLGNCMEKQADKRRNRYLINFQNPDCGVGHAVSLLNGQVKLARKCNLKLGYSPKTIEKSSSATLYFRIKSILRFIMKGKFSHSHNIGAGIDILFNPGPLTEDLDEILERVKDGEAIALFPSHMTSGGGGGLFF